jgi:hypothetical protein
MAAPPTPSGGKPSHSGSSFGSDVRRDGSALDVALLALVPVALLATFEGVSGGPRLALDVRTPSFWSLFLTHYFHRSVGHLLGNLLAYALVAPTLYLLAILCDWRRTFRQLFVVVSVLFPAVLSGLYLWVIAGGQVLGYSALALAFLGVLPVVLVRYLRVQFDVTMSTWPSVGLFGLGVGVLAVPLLVGETLDRRLLTLSVLGAGAIYSLWMLPPAVGQSLRSGRRRGHVALGVGSLAVFFIVAVLATPSTGRVTGVAVVHLLGYLLGFGVALVGTLTERSIDRTWSGREEQN